MSACADGFGRVPGGSTNFEQQKIDSSVGAMVCGDDRISCGASFGIVKGGR
jgi:hypothetical protein